MSISEFRRKRHLWREVIKTPSSIIPIPGLYAIYVRGKLVYIGLSNRNVQRRVFKHIKIAYDRSMPTETLYETNWGVVEESELVVKVAYSRKFGDWAAREIRLINRLRPQSNTLVVERLTGAWRQVYA